MYNSHHQTTTHFAHKSTPSNSLRVNADKNAIFYKTKLCPAFQKGCCFNGDGCQYAHSLDELRPMPDLSKTRLCESLLKGTMCEAGPGCPFAHSLEERRVDPLIHKKKLCGSISRGVPCIWGDKCQFVHSDPTQQSLLAIRESSSDKKVAGYRSRRPPALNTNQPPPPPPPP
eukprot:Platyproteum_vivax@DN1207_c0_g1_i2.p1